MLHRLYVKNVALISEADIEFDEKLNVLSGETGSGKSVILDSINFVLGSKADKTMIRFGEREAVVRAEFFVDENSAAAQKLREFDIDCEGLVSITRKFDVDGKGNIKINGNTVTAGMLKSVTAHLVDVHGQSEHFFLLNEDNQLKVIDGIAGAEIEGIKKNLAKIISEKREIKARLAGFGGDESERERALDLLNYQINEIEKAEVRADEFEELKARQNVILNVEKILSSINAAYSVLSGEGGCLDGISIASRYVNSIAGIDEAYDKLSERLESLSAEASDVAETISDIADGLCFDAGEAEAIADRLALLKNLRRKYGADEREILEFLENARKKADELNDCSGVIKKLEKQLDACDDKTYSLCKLLTEKRVYSAKKFCTAVENELKTLNIPNARFQVDFNEYDRSSANLNSANGSDKICFMFSANSGEPVKPLSKVISGGEMSRFMLAIKTQLKDINGITTYIFDEIDAGISGFTAKTVAEKFVKISGHTQILAVSHLPQMCAASDAQYLIYKIEESGKTVTKVKRLCGEEKIDEIIRLTGGAVNSAASRQHADELIRQFVR